MKSNYIILVLLFIVLGVGFFLFTRSQTDTKDLNSSTLNINNGDVVQIISDVPRDAIPPLDNPKYVSVEESDWLEDDDLVLVVQVNVDIRAYPIKIMNWHEIVNDTIGGMEVVVTYCPLCDSGIVFDRNVDGKLLSFGNTGALYESSMVMYDRETESYWYQAGGRSIKGELTGSKLKVLPSFMSRWEEWKKNNPNSLVLSLDTGHRRPYEINSFDGYDSLDSKPGFPVSDMSDILPPKERVVGIVINGKSKAYPVRRAKNTTLKDTFEGKDIEIVGDSTGRTAQVFYIENGKRVRAPIISEFWFSWFISHKDTKVYK